MAKKPGSAADPLWYKDAIIYELHVRAFKDSNGDGIGDFPGLIQKMDYLQGLGVTCLWLLPFFLSPLKDDGYDIADYLNVHPMYGTIEDFRAVLAAAHERDLQVMIELVVNHTSDQHPWFQAARRAPPGSPERDFYVWSDTEDKYKDARIIFSDTERSNWTWDPVAKQYFWHRFFSHQPDLNYDNPRVVEEVLKVMRYWLDMGVDALRVDAIPYLVERDGTSCENLPETHEVIKTLRREIDADYSKPGAAGRSQPVAHRRSPLLRRGRRMPHGVPFSADAAHLHGTATGRPAADHRHHRANSGHSGHLSVGSFPTKPR